MPHEATDNDDGPEKNAVPGLSDEERRKAAELIQVGVTLIGSCVKAE